MISMIRQHFRSSVVIYLTYGEERKSVLKKKIKDVVTAEVNVHLSCSLCSYNIWLFVIVTFAFGFLAWYRSFSRKKMTLHIILLTLFLTSTVYTEESGTFFKVEENYFLLNKNIILDSKGKSLRSCSQICARREDCKSVNFQTDQGTCSLLRETLTENPDMLVELKSSLYLEKLLDVGSSESPESLGTTPSIPVPTSCQTLRDQNTGFSSGVYWIDPDGESQDNAFKVYCDMDTEGGGWTLAWSYTFTDYDDFKDGSNAVTPRPNWPANVAVGVSISTTPPLHETDYNAINFSQWRQLGRQVLIKSNINNWLVCDPGTGSLVDWKGGRVNCQLVKHVTSTCKSTPAPTDFIASNSYGPMYHTSTIKSGVYYYFDGSTRNDWPTHDPCGLNSENNLQNVVNPHGNIFIR